MSLSGERCKLFSCCSQLASDSPSISISPSVLLSSAFQHTRKSLQCRYDYVFWPERRAYIIVFMSVRACVHHSVSWFEERTNSWNTWQKIYLFQSKRKQRQTPNDTRLLYEACESTFSSLSIPPLQVNPAVNPWATHFFHFYGPFNVTIISHSQAVCYLPACADSIWTQCFSFAK